MIKVVLSNRAYLKPDDELLERLQDNLTYETQAGFKNAPVRYIHNYGPVIRGTYWIPIERLDLLQDREYTIVDKRVSVPVDMPTPSFTLRDDQQEVYDAVNDTALINAAPGWGKTIAALAIAHKLGQKTLIVCTTTTIRDMWMAEIVKFFGFKASMVGSGKSDTSQMITVGNIQTLTKNSAKYTTEFGLVIFDECHHTPASTFTKLLLDSKARYKLGLSGTLHRKDGLHVIFKDYFGFNILQPKIANTIPPTVHRFKSGAQFPGNAMMPWANRVTELTQNEMYRAEILALIQVYVDMGHKVILVSDRVDFLKYVHETTNVRTALFIGGSSTEERQVMFDDMTEGNLDLFCASQSIFSEGVSQNNLSCMILGSPISDNRSLLSQLAGRIMRKDDAKLNPVLVDMLLKGDSARGQANKRKAIYRMFSWDMLDIDLPYLVNRSLQAKGLIK